MRLRLVARASQFAAETRGKICLADCGILVISSASRKRFRITRVPLLENIYPHSAPRYCHAPWNYGFNRDSNDLAFFVAIASAMAIKRA